MLPVGHAAVGRLQNCIVELINMRSFSLKLVACPQWRSHQSQWLNAHAMRRILSHQRIPQSRLVHVLNLSMYLFSGTISILLGTWAQP